MNELINWFKQLTGKKKPYKIGIALGGGGAKGFAHLGVLQALKERGVHPGCISGVSAGAIVGGIIAQGREPIEALQIMKSFNLYDMTSFKIPKMGLLGLNKLEAFLKEHLPNDSFKKLNIPLIVAVTNLNKGIVEYRSNGSLSKTILASSSIPVLFNPVALENDLYVDGGLLDNLPVFPLLDTCEFIIGVNISPLEKVDSFSNLIDIATRTFDLSDKQQIEQNSKRCHVFIEPKGLSGMGVFDTNNIQQLFDLGYDAGMSTDLSKLN